MAEMRKPTNAFSQLNEILPKATKKMGKNNEKFTKILEWSLRILKPSWFDNFKYEGILKMCPLLQFNEI